MAEYTYGQPRKGAEIAKFPPRRTCAAPECSTRLSIYNATDYCSVHGRHIPRDRPKK